MGNSQWKTLKKCPAFQGDVVMINDNEMIITPPSKCLYKYNISKNKWYKSIKYPKDFRIFHTHIVCDEEEQKLLSER